MQTLTKSAKDKIASREPTLTRKDALLTMRLTLIDCTLGRLLVAGTQKGVCAVYLGDDDEMLQHELQQEFPRATTTRDDEGLHAWAQQVAQTLLDPSLNPNLSEPPLDMQGTEFQHKVWLALRLIPRGQQRTYREVAQSLGMPTAARAVARACATNPVSLVIPCHRVVRGDGGLGGYRWGLDRKRKLLDHEKSSSIAEAPASSSTTTCHLMGVFPD